MAATAAQDLIPRQGLIRMTYRDYLAIAICILLWLYNRFNER